MAKIVVSGKRHKVEIHTVRQTAKNIAPAISEAIANFRQSEVLSISLLLNNRSYLVANLKAGNREFDANLIVKQINQVVSYSKARESLMSSLVQRAGQFDISHAPGSFDPEASEVFNQGFGFMSPEFGAYTNSHLCS